MAAPGSFSSLIVGQVVVEATGQNLYLNGQILAAGASGSVASINSQSGAISLAGAGNVSILTNGPIITVSGNTGIYSTFVTTSQTGGFGGSANTGVLTGAFYPLNSNPSNYITQSQTGLFYSAANPSQFATSGVLNTSITGLSGYDAATYATINNLASTGSSLNILITGLSGTLTGYLSKSGNLIDLTNKQTARVNLGGSPEFQSPATYVSTAGSDTNDGQSWSTPMRTPSTGIRQILLAGGNGSLYISGTYVNTGLGDLTNIRNLNIYGTDCNFYYGVKITGAAWSLFSGSGVNTGHRIYRATYSGGFIANDLDGGAGYIFEENIPEGPTDGELHPRHAAKPYVLKHRRVKYSPNLSGLLTGVALSSGSGKFYYDSGNNFLYLRNIDGINPSGRTHWVPSMNNTDSLVGAYPGNNVLKMYDINSYFGYYCIDVSNWPNFELNRCTAYGGRWGHYSVPTISGTYNDCAAYANRDDGFIQLNSALAAVGTQQSICYINNAHSAYNGDEGISPHNNVMLYVKDGLSEHNRSSAIVGAFGCSYYIENLFTQSNNRYGEENGYLDPTSFRGVGISLCCGGPNVWAKNCYVRNETVGYYQRQGNITVVNCFADSCDQAFNNSAPLTSTITSITGSGSNTLITENGGLGFISNQKVTLLGVSGNTPSLNGIQYTITDVNNNSFTIPVTSTVFGSGGTVVRNNGIIVAGLYQYNCGDPAPGGFLASGASNLADLSVGKLYSRSTGSNQVQIRKLLQGGSSDYDLLRMAYETADGTALTSALWGFDGSANALWQTNRALTLWAGTDYPISLRTFGSAGPDYIGGFFTLKQFGTIALPTRTVDPTASFSSSGDAYYNSASGIFRGYTSGQWRTFLMS